MGSPISGLLAEMKLRIMEKKIPHKFKNEIKFWFRYVDDIIAVLRKGVSPEEVLNNLNKEDENIKFKLEIEKGHILNFLDVKIMREGERILTTVFRKPQSNLEIINKKCKTPYSYKLAALRSYINRAIIVCSNKELLKEEINLIKRIGRKAGYHPRTVDKLYENRIKQIK